MKSKSTKVLAVVFMLIATILTMSACSPQVPNGRYEASENAFAHMNVIIIDGNNITFTIMGMGITSKYEYNPKTGAITILDGSTGVTYLEYKNGSIWESGITEYKKVK